MKMLKKGSRGIDVKGLQMRLNTRLKPSPKLKPDGIFGTATERAVLTYQKAQRLAADGIVGPKTMKALAAPPKTPAPPNLKKFLSEVGTVADFVGHVAMLETGASTSQLMDSLSDFATTASQKRYLLVTRDSVGVIDFRHFFAAMSESYNSGLSKKSGPSLGGSPGTAVLLGLGNELAQCVSEGYKSKLNSCFSREDLGSNRLGAAFGELIKVRESEASKSKVSALLRETLSRLGPATGSQTANIKTQGPWDIAMESLAALLSGIGDILVPRAY